jgi:hypothetical protein
MCIKTGVAEKTGAWVSPVWIPQWIEEKGSAAGTPGGKKNGDRPPTAWCPPWNAEKANAAERLHGISGTNVLVP